MLEMIQLETLIVRLLLPSACPLCELESKVQPS